MSIQTDLAVQERENEFHIDQVLALLDERDGQEALSDTQLIEFVYLAAVAYGLVCDLDLIPKLVSLYELFARRINLDERTATYRAVENVVEEYGTSVNALLPFMFEEPEISLASTATLDFAVLCPLDNDDPLTGPRFVLREFEEGAAECRPGLFAGLLLLGDRRVTRLLWKHRDSLTREEVKLLVGAQSGFLFAATIEFYLDWLEERDGDHDDGIFGSLASGLMTMRQRTLSDTVLDAERIFPAQIEAGSTIRRRYTIDEYTQIIRDRLIAIEEKEVAPKIMHHALEAWGIGAYWLN
jgi:hypothetical protein